MIAMPTFWELVRFAFSRQRPVDHELVSVFSSPRLEMLAALKGAEAALEEVTRDHGNDSCEPCVALGYVKRAIAKGEGR